MDHLGLIDHCQDHSTLNTGPKWQVTRFANGQKTEVYN